MKTTSLLIFLTSLTSIPLSTSLPGIVDRIGPRDDALTLEEALARKEAQISHEDSLKYFHEPGRHEEGDDDRLGHFDTRYFKGKLSYTDKRAVQLHMVRAYLDTFRQKGLETWISHGTLLGWWWNGAMLPWDWDIDTQVSESTLMYLGGKLNGTSHTYTDEIDGKSITTTYLLDVNPFSAERVRGNGMNIIDARWINTENGMYIDITGLSELEPSREPGVVSCKNNHKYLLGDFYPLRPTQFEGVNASVPYEYTTMLVEEYGDKALIVTEFEGHVWSEKRRKWDKLPVLTTQEGGGAEVLGPDESNLV